MQSRLAELGTEPGASTPRPQAHGHLGDRSAVRRAMDPRGDQDLVPGRQHPGLLGDAGADDQPVVRSDAGAPARTLLVGDPEDVVEGTRARYIEAYERITGKPFDEWLALTGAA